MKQLGEGWNWRDLKVGDRFVTYAARCSRPTC